MTTAGTRISYSFSNAPSRPQLNALFIQGVPDDGLVQITAEIEGANTKNVADSLRNFQFASVLSRHVLGSLNHFEYVSVPGLTNQCIILVGDEKQPVKFDIPHIIVNCIADPDVATRALEQEQKLIEQIQQRFSVTIPVINPPSGIARTTRDKIYEQFKDLPGLHIPRVIRIKPVSVADTVRQIKEAGIRLPFLIRTTGTHGGKGMQRIDSWSESELFKLECYPYDGRDFYVTEWVDFKDSDGLYRKARFVIVNGMFVPRHQIVAPDWNVHGGTRAMLMQDSEKQRELEARFVRSSMDELAGTTAIASLRKIHASLGLDYFGVDCSIREDGSLLIFEINAAVNTMLQAKLDIYPYLADPMNRIIKIFNDMVGQRAILAQTTPLAAS